RSYSTLSLNVALPIFAEVKRPIGLAQAAVDRQRAAVRHEGDEGAEDAHRSQRDDEGLYSPEGDDEAIEEPAEPPHHQGDAGAHRSEEHTSELQSRETL